MLRRRQISSSHIGIRLKRKTKSASQAVYSRVVDPDPDPYWIRIQLGLWIRIRIRIRNTDPDPGGQK
jgi:hypothetical protein